MKIQNNSSLYCAKNPFLTLGMPSRFVLPIMTPRAVLKSNGVAIALAILLIFSVSLMLPGTCHLLGLGLVASSGLFGLLGVMASILFQNICKASWATPQTQPQICKEAPAQRSLDRVSNREVQTRARVTIQIQIQLLSAAKQAVEESIKRFRALTGQLEFLDLIECSDLHHALNSLPGEIQVEARIELHNLKKKLRSNDLLKRLGQGAVSNNAFVTQALERAHKALSAGRVELCREALKDAYPVAVESLRLSEQIRRFTDQLKGAAANVVAEAETRVWRDGREPAYVVTRVPHSCVNCLPEKDCKNSVGT